MASSALLEIAAALHNRLASDSILSTLLNGIFDGTAPSNHSFPYCVINDWTEVNAIVVNRVDRDVTVNLHFFSEYRGAAEVMKAQARAVVLIDHQFLPIENWHLIDAKLDSTQVFTESDEVRHGIVRFRFRVAPKYA